MTYLIINWRGCGRILYWPILRYWPGEYLEGLRTTTKNLNHNYLCPVRDSNRSSPKYNSETLPHKSAFSVTFLRILILTFVRYVTDKLRTPNVMAFWIRVIKIFDVL
jgi:hypothetical protein